MKILLHGIQKNHVIYIGFAENAGARNITSYLPYNYHVRYGDVSDISDTTPVLDKIDSYDLMVFSPRSFMDPNFSKILNSQSSSTKIFIDNDDDFFVRRIYTHNQIKFYFKRELYSAFDSSAYKSEWTIRYLYGGYIFEPINDKAPIAKSWGYMALPYAFAVKSKRLKKLFSYPVTVQPQKIPEMKRTTDLFFSMPLKTVNDRKLYYKTLIRLQRKYASSKMIIKTGGLPKDMYLKNIKAAKCSVAVRGGGYDSDRYWEIPCYGAALLAQKTPLAIENNFVNEESALMFGSEEELRRKFKKYILDSNEWKEIAKKGEELYFAHHTPKKRVRELILNRL